jgi:hypothetical protein
MLKTCMVFKIVYELRLISFPSGFRMTYDLGDSVSFLITPGIQMREPF